MYVIQSDITSKNTSVNSKKFPAIYNRLDWGKLMREWACKTRFESTPVVLDIGCGRYTDQIEHFLATKGFIYKGYDPYWKSEEENEKSLSLKPFIVICSNVLNVIKDKEVYHNIQSLVRSFHYRDKFYREHPSLFFITVYEGDRSYVGQITKKDCYQRNLPLNEYLYNVNDVIYKRTLTSLEGIEFLR